MNKRIIASALAVTMGAGLVGSISGTVAWYQYSTRATIQMIGLSLGTEKALEIAVAANQPAADSEAWKTELKTADILAYYKTQPGNSSKSDTPLSDWANSLNINKSDLYVYPDTSLDFLDFEKFIKARQELLIQKLESVFSI